MLLKDIEKNPEHGYSNTNEGNNYLGEKLEII